MKTARPCICGARSFEPVFEYHAPPAGEVRFSFSSGGGYRRDVLRCVTCGHFISVHGMDTSRLYEGDYVSSTYRDEEGLRRTFDRIVSLPPEKSDNAGRVDSIQRFASGHFSDGFSGRTLLDVGSGLGVFLHRMKAQGWSCTALDPDRRAAAHLEKHVGVTALCSDFMAAMELGQFDAITFNKVLEHVVDPVAMLRKAAPYLKPGGFVYVELPDGEAARADGPGREEFFIDHHHIFSFASLAILASRAGFELRAMERLREPSSKFTLRAFLVGRRGGDV